MTIALDHVFVCTEIGAPEGDALLAAGFAEGPPNVHPGQGTACRRFFFHNAYLELLWVHDAAEARSATTAPTRLWERWQGRDDGRTCPLGVCVRAGPGASVPFPTWPYRPSYLPPGGAIPVATSSDALGEPMLFALPFVRRPDAAPTGEAPPLAHAAGVREVTRATLAGPWPSPSAPLAAVEEAGIVTLDAAERFTLTLELDGAPGGRVLDLRPALPLVLRW